MLLYKVSLGDFIYWCHGLSLQRNDLAITSVTSLLANQPVASESERARDQVPSAGQSEFFVPVSRLQN